MVICLGQILLMGRTVPTWRNRIEAELVSLDNFQRALNAADRDALNRLINGVRNRHATGACYRLTIHGSQCCCLCC